MYPKVSILVPTRDRPNYIPQLLNCIFHQTYPKDKIEVIVADDGKRPIQHLLPPTVKYLRYNTPITLAEKRQYLADNADGEIMVCMDDDDYYPPERVSHAVSTLQKTPGAEIAFCPTLYFYYPTENRIYSCGPWESNWPHATFAFTKKYLETHSYQKSDAFGEERMFTDYFKAPHAVLDPEKTIMALVHNENTVPKNNLGKRRLTRHTLMSLVKDKRSLMFYSARAGKVGGPVVVNPRQNNQVYMGIQIARNRSFFGRR
jgi:glycosyltransferase involved in cell wall biosynthesis